jgi:hypothetical protein
LCHIFNPTHQYSLCNQFNPKVDPHRAVWLPAAVNLLYACHIIVCMYVGSPMHVCISQCWIPSFFQSSARFCYRTKHSQFPGLPGPCQQSRTERPFDAAFGLPKWCNIPMLQPGVCVHCQETHTIHHHNYMKHRSLYSGLCSTKVIIVSREIARGPYLVPTACTAKCHWLHIYVQQGRRRIPPVAFFIWHAVDNALTSI